MTLAAGHEDPHLALDFFVDWANLAAAAELVRGGWLSSTVAIMAP